ncbi:hypothetical protein UK14_30415, partial [Streptomyces sp. NRRL F-4428]
MGRFSAATCPQSGHVREVLRGSTAITSRPALSALACRIVRPEMPFLRLLGPVPAHELFAEAWRAARWGVSSKWRRPPGEGGGGGVR